MKQGKLLKNTYFYTFGGPVFKAKAGTDVFMDRGVLHFNPIEGVSITKLNGCYFINLWGSVHRIVLPKGGKPPFPLTLL